MKTFSDGDWVLLTTDKGKNWLVRLIHGEYFSCHLGTIAHDEIIGKQEGDEWITPKGQKIFFFSPTLTDFLFHIKRRTQIIYPKDIGAILCYGDIRPHMSVLESGVGSGALTVFLLAYLAGCGILVSVEAREEFAKLAENNIRRVFGKKPDNWHLVVSDIELPGISAQFDRLILDLPEPWKAVPSATPLLKRGGILVSLSPQISQIQWVNRELKKQGFRFIQVFEILKRDWYVDEKRLRPMDRMVAHTGFLIVARKTY